MTAILSTPLPPREEAPPLPDWVRRLMPGVWKFLGSVWVGEVTITAGNAEVIVNQHNRRNRPLSQTAVRELVGYMARGEFLFNGETLVFGPDGLILNAQHRLTALSRMRDGTEVKFLAVVGIPEDTFDTFDQQRSRKPWEVLSMHGEGNPRTLATAGSAALHFLISGRAQSGRSICGLSTATLCDVVREDLPGIRESVAFAARYPKVRTRRFRGESAPALFHWIFSRVDRAAADSFWDGLLGATEQEPAPAGWLRALNARLERNLYRNTRLQALTTDALVVIAWNRIREGMECHHDRRCLLRHPEGAAFPQVRGWTYDDRARPSLPGLSARALGLPGFREEEGDGAQD